jgi:hypothetical protein
MRRTVCLLLVVLLGGSACTTTSTTAPESSTVDLTGTWTGTLTVQGIPVLVKWTLSQTGANISGSALALLADGTVLTNGSLTGTMSGSTLTYTITVGPGGIPAQPSCTGQLQGSLAVQLGLTPIMNGSLSLVSATCTPPVSSGSLALSKTS